MNYIKNIDYKKTIIPLIVVVVAVGSFFFQKYKLNNTEMESIPIQKEEVVLKKETKLSTIKIDGVDFEFKEDVLEYDLIVSNDTETLNITAITTGGENADIKLGKGNKLLVGNNKITVDVKNNSKTIKYTFNVYRKNVDLICPENTFLDDDKCVTKNFIQSANAEYSCSGDSIQQGDKCIKIEYQSASVSETCEKGYTKTGNECQKKDIKNKEIISYTCSNKANYTWRFDGSKCVYEKNYTAQLTYYCTDNGNLNGSECEITKTNVEMEEKITYCDYEENCQGHLTKVCPEGTVRISNDTCALIEKVPAKERYECLQGGEYIGAKKCSQIEYVTPTNIQYGCPSGYSPTSTGKCEKLLKKETFKNHSCSKGFTFTDGKCKKETIVNANETLRCPQGLKADKETKQCYEEILSQPTKIEE